MNILAKIDRENNNSRNSQGAVLSFSKMIKKKQCLNDTVIQRLGPYSYLENESLATVFNYNGVAL